MIDKHSDDYRHNDIIDFPYPHPMGHPRMSLYNRAAQFMTFKALSGYGEDTDKVARLTDVRIDLDENRISDLDARLQHLRRSLTSEPTVSITFFKQDERKDGCRYETITGGVKKIDDIHRVIIFQDRQQINIDDVYAIEGTLFDAAESEI